MACNCLDEKLTMCKDALNAHMQKSTYGSVEGSGTVMIVGKFWVLSGKDDSPLALMVKSEFRENKKDGSPKKNLTKLDNYLKIKFCPFCGTEHTGEKL